MDAATAIRRSRVLALNMVKVRARPRVAFRAVRLARRARWLGAVQKVAELAPFLVLVERQRPSVVVEIGTYRGGTLAAISELVPEGATLISVDLPGGNFGGGYDVDDIPRLRALTRRAQLVPILGDSHSEETLERVRSVLDGRRADILVIDGDHSYEGVRADFEMYAPLVCVGGLIAFHDIAEHPGIPACQVHVFWREISERRRALELFDPSDERGAGQLELFDPTDERGAGQWGGIGVLL